MGYNVNLKAACTCLFYTRSLNEIFKDSVVISGAILEFDEWYLNI